MFGWEIDECFLAMLRENHQHYRELWNTLEGDLPESDIVGTMYSGEMASNLDNFGQQMVGEFEEYAAETGLLEVELLVRRSLFKLYLFYFILVDKFMISHPSRSTEL